MIEIIKYIILGIIQGFTEPLPISSSGHIEIAKEFLHIDDLGLSFSIITNFASMIVIVIYFRKKILKLINGFFTYIIKKDKKYKSDFNYSIKVIVASVPIAVIGVLVVVTGIDDYLTDSLLLVTIGLLITAIMLILVSKIDGHKKVSQLSLYDTLFIGFFQAIAIVPGISRSGLSLVGSLARKMDKKEAFEFVFILYIPASVGAMIPSITDLLDDPNLSSLLVPYFFAFVFTMIFTLISLIVLKKIVIAQKLHYFSIYLFIMVIILTTYMVIV